MARHFLHIPRWALQAAAYTLLLCIVLFFALTRTEVGRDALRVQLERQFNAALEGRLEIGELRGNLLYTLFARDVRIYDPEGRLVVSAEAVTLQPGWRDLLQRTLSAEHIELTRPEVHLLRQEDGRWNITDAFAPSNPRDSTGLPWSFTSAYIRLSGGRLTTQYRGAPPRLHADSLLFNYAETEVNNVQARGTLEWRGGFKLVDIHHLSGDVPTLDLGIHRLQGQLVVDHEHFTFNELSLQTDSTDLDLNGLVHPLSLLTPAHIGEVQVDLSLNNSRIHHGELQRIFPRLPLADAVAASARIRGPLSNLSIDQVSLARGRSRLAAAGTLSGFPDSLSFNLTFADNTLSAADLQAILPTADLTPFQQLNHVRLSGKTNGVFALKPESDTSLFRITSRLSVESEAGRLEGTLSLSQTRDHVMQYSADLQGQALDVGRILNQAHLSSRLNGRLALQGTGTVLDTTKARLALSLSHSSLAGRTVDSLYVRAAAAAGQLDVAAFADQGAGRLQVRASADLGSPQRAYRLDATAHGLDLGPLLDNDTLQTHLNAHLALQGTGYQWQHLNGNLELAFDTSSVRLGSRLHSVPPNRSSLVLAQMGRARPRLHLSGDVLDLEVQGDIALAPFMTLSQLWGHAVAEALRREIDKPYRPREAAEASQQPDQALSRLMTSTYLRETARAHLEQAGLSSQELQARLHILRSDILRALAPMLPPLQTDLKATATLRAGADRLHVEGSVQGDTLHIGLLQAGPLRADVQLSADLDAPPAQILQANLQAASDHVTLARQHFQAPRLVAGYSQRQGRLYIGTGQDPMAAAPLRLSARLDVLPGRNRLTFTDLYFALDDYAWSTEGSSSIDLYADAVVVDNLALQNQGAPAQDVQRIRLSGTLSQAPEDTLSLDLQNVLLHQVSNVAALPYTIGGRLDGRIALAGITRQPEVTGDLHVAALSFDNRILGRLDLSSRYLPGHPEVALDAYLRPSPADSSTGILPGTLVPAVRESNHLTLGGTFRLPRFDTRGRRTAPGALQLTLEARRADLFFFEYIFPSVLTGVKGHAAGRIHIGGTFRKPLFEGAFKVDDGSFSVPSFNLQYALQGAARVDAEGFKLDDVVLTDPTGGTADISGSILFNDYRYFSFDLLGRLDELQIIDVMNARDLPFYGQIWASGSATLRGPVSNVMLRSTNAVTSPNSNLFIPITQSTAATDASFIVFADSAGALPDLQQLSHRANLLSHRPVGERPFLDGMEMDLNILAPEGSTVHLVIDPLVGDVINAVSSGRIQLQRSEGEFFTYGQLDVTSGDYLFSAGEVFFRRFLIDEGRITWDGDPLNALLDIRASYRTRASSAGLNLGVSPSLLPVIVRLDVTGRVAAPAVDLRLALEHNNRHVLGSYEGLEAVLNQPERMAQYATSVLLTNSFLLTTNLTEETGRAGTRNQFTNTRNQLAFNSLSQLVASQLNRYLNQALPNLNLNFGVQGESTQDLDVTYGVALRLLDERLIIRGQGIYQNDQTQRRQQSLLDEFVVEVRLRPNVSVEVFYRREADLLTAEPLGNTAAGAGLSYETRFTTWKRLARRLFGWLLPEAPAASTEPTDDEAIVHAEK